MNPGQLTDLVIYYQSPVFLIRQDHRSPHLSAGVRGSVTHCGTIYECRGSLRRAEATGSTCTLVKVALAPVLDSYSIRHRDPLALDQGDFVTFVDISNSVATDTDRGQGGRLQSTYTNAGTLNIYLSNSTRVIKKPPRVGAGV